jgi:hypothetical protein
MLYIDIAERLEQKKLVDAIYELFEGGVDL